jgi:hypothetical protein
MRKKACFFKTTGIVSLICGLALTGVLLGGCYLLTGGNNQTTTIYIVYTVSFYPGEGRGTAPASQTVKEGKSITLPGQGGMIAPEGKTFAGWKTTGSPTYNTGVSLAIYDDTLFIAQWTGGKENVD